MSVTHTVTLSCIAECAPGTDTCAATIKSKLYAAVLSLPVPHPFVSKGYEVLFGDGSDFKLTLTTTYTPEQAFLYNAYEDDDKNQIVSEYIGPNDLTSVSIDMGFIDSINQESGNLRILVAK